MMPFSARLNFVFFPCSFALPEFLYLHLFTTFHSNFVVDCRERILSLSIPFSGHVLASLLDLCVVNLCYNSKSFALHFFSFLFRSLWHSFILSFLLYFTLLDSWFPVPFTPSLLWSFIYPYSISHSSLDSPVLLSRRYSYNFVRLETSVHG